MDASTLGERIRSVRRRRGLTQRELATAAGVSESLIKKLEQEQITDVRLETLHKIAVALKVSTTQLAAGTDAQPAQPGDITAWEPVRLALEGRHPAPPDEEPTLAGAQTAFTSLVPLLTGNKFDELRTLLPSLLRDADALVSLSVDGQQVRARRLRSQARQVGSLLMSHTWQFGPASAAIADAIDDARADPLVMMGAIDERCWGLLRAGALTEARQLAEQWAADAEPARITRATPAELAAWGRLCLRVSSVAARDNRPHDAAEALRHAQIAAAGLSRDSRLAATPWQVFGLSTVATIEAENAVIQGYPEQTLQVTGTLTARQFPVSRHYWRSQLDKARALAMTRRNAEAVEVLRTARTAAPQWLVQQRGARDTLAMVITARKRTLTPEVRELADAVRLPL
jgi:transcriptional regulator with XRE-family HTH domain